MKPAPFAYVRPATVEEALGWLKDPEAGAKVMAGGQSLVPMLNMRLAQPSTVVDIGGLKELSTITVETLNGQTMLRVGALVTQRDLEHFVSQDSRWRLLHLALKQVGHPQTRNRGTVGGSLMHADPAAELPLALRLLDGSVGLESWDGKRRVSARDFFQFVYVTAAESDELLVESWWPAVEPGTGVSFLEFSRRRGDFAIVAAAAVTAVAPDGSVTRLDLAVGGLADAALVIDTRPLLGRPFQADAVRSLLAERLATVTPPDDMHATSGFRRHLGQVFAARAVQAALDNGRGRRAPE